MPISNSNNEIVETLTFTNPEHETEHTVRVLCDLEQKTVKFLARDLGACLHQNLSTTKRLVSEQCSSPEAYTGDKLDELSDKPGGMKQVCLLSPSDAKKVRHTESIVVLNALGRFVDEVVESKREVSVEDVLEEDPVPEEQGGEPRITHTPAQQ